MLFRDRAFISLESIASTNNYAAKLLKVSNPPDGTVITAQEQTQGKGQRGSQWFSEAGQNLLCSIVCYPKFLPVRQQFYLSKSVSLAVAEMLEEYLELPALIKWPNDIIVQEKKIAGLLLEFNWMETRIQSAVCGIGLNINQATFEYPHATSVFLASGKKADIDECLSRLVKSFDKHYLQLQSGFYSDIDNAYRSRLFRLNTPSTFVFRGEKISAVIRGVDESGKLLVLPEGSRLQVCDLKDISMVY
ncbi:MAG: biotin--[acetyl-CoA-carboxylase] ligase [Crocinitomicaceae bacterium]|nr:biotin--[acetyl-CoA-carboxylase] ligase [Crocinitomicaceae bacterium]